MKEPAMTALADLSAHALLDGYRARALSPVDVVEAVLARIAEREPDLCATYALDPEGALLTARQSAARWQAGAPCGALDGVPITLKENIATRGTPMPLGTAASDLTPLAADAPPAARGGAGGGGVGGGGGPPGLGLGAARGV
jgi:Asp-tRNA(Asn)/Glu-tRNA(Gln) amidotransferase A subunit family amidase